MKRKADGEPTERLQLPAGTSTASGIGTATSSAVWQASDGHYYCRGHDGRDYWVPPPHASSSWHPCPPISHTSQGAERRSADDARRRKARKKRLEEWSAKFRRALLAIGDRDFILLPQAMGMAEVETARTKTNLGPTLLNDIVGVCKMDAERAGVVFTPPSAIVAASNLSHGKAAHVAPSFVAPEKDDDGSGQGTPDASAAAAAAVNGAGGNGVSLTGSSCSNGSMGASLYDVGTPSLLENPIPIPAVVTPREDGGDDVHASPPNEQSVTPSVLASALVAAAANAKTDDDDVSDDNEYQVEDVGTADTDCVRDAILTIARDCPPCIRNLCDGYIRKLFCQIDANDIRTTNLSDSASLLYFPPDSSPDGDANATRALEDSKKVLTNAFPSLGHEAAVIGLQSRGRGLGGLDRHHSSSLYDTLVLSDGGECTSICMWKMLPKCKAVWISWLVAKEEFKGKGCASVLVDCVKDFAKGIGIKIIYLEVGVPSQMIDGHDIELWTRAQTFYRHKGFVTADVVPDGVETCRLHLDEQYEILKCDLTIRVRPKRKCKSTGGM